MAELTDSLGNIQDHHHEFIVMGTDKPGLLYVYEGQVSEATEVCRIHNCGTGSPIAIFEGRWYGNMPQWKDGLVALAVAKWTNAHRIPVS